MFTTKQFDSIIKDTYGISERSMQLYRKQGKAPLGNKLGKTIYYDMTDLKIIRSIIKVKYYL